MSFKLMGEALSIKTGSCITKMVLLKLCDNANDSGECWPSYNTIANHCEVSKRSVMNHINKLIDMGIVTKEIRREGSKNKSNLYTISLGGSESPALPSERAALGGSEPPAPEPISIKPISEPFFDTFWKAYPKKVMKGNAEKAFNKIIKTISLDVLLSGIKGSPQFKGSDKQYMPNAQAWINGKGYLDCEIAFDYKSLPFHKLNKIYTDKVNGKIYDASGNISKLWEYDAELKGGLLR